MPSTAPTKFIAYYRVSTDKQGRSGLGIEAQRDIVRRHLTGTDGYPPILEFTETESGRKVDRKELALALASCRVHRATLIIAKMDRLARNQQFLMSLIDSGVDIVFCDFPQIPAGAQGRFIMQQMSAVAELEAGLISERTKAALKAKVERDGQWDRKSKHHLVPGAGQKAAAQATRDKANARAADLEGTLRAMVSDRKSLNGMAAALNEQGIPSARGGRWTATGVKRVLARLAA